MSEEDNFPCNIIDIMFKLSIDWRGPNLGFRGFEKGHGPTGSLYGLTELKQNLTEQN